MDDFSAVYGSMAALRALSIIISAIAGISLKSELLHFFQFNFCRDFKYLLKKFR